MNYVRWDRVRAAMGSVADLALSFRVEDYPSHGDAMEKQKYVRLHGADG